MTTVRGQLRDRSPQTPSLRRHILRTLTLAGPVVVARVGMVGLSSTDVIVLGRADAEALAAYVLAAALYESLIGTLAGLLLGVPVMAARLFGAGDTRTLGSIWRRGLPYALLVGGCLAGALQGAETLFLWSGQDPVLAARAGAVVRVLGMALPLLGLFLVSASFLEAINRPKFGMVAVLLANLANLGFNVLFVFGAGPIPAMGALGCAIATVLTAGLLAAGLGSYVRFGLKDREALGLTVPASDGAEIGRGRTLLGWWRALTPIRHPGYAAGLSYTLEASAFSALTLVVGLLGTLALAINGVLFQFLVIPFMVAFGLATATQVRVGNAWGRTDARGLWLAGWIGLALTVLVTGSVALSYLLAPAPLVRLFTTEDAVIAGAVPVLGWVALALIFDGGQTVMNHACRGRGDTWVPTGLHLISYWGILVPAAILLTLIADQGVAGIFQAVALASVVSLVAMTLRFATVARRPLEKQNITA